VYSDVEEQNGEENIRTQEGRGGWKKLHKEELQNLFLALCNILNEGDGFTLAPLM
jgi:hypothetical protein